MSFKRPRTPARSSSSDSSSPTLEPTAKSSRTNTSSSSRPLLCTLPPTCNPPRNQPTHIANTRELETHYATYHAHVCEFQGCGCVFPDARLLELHQTECHDPLAALRKDRGEKIFACHLSTCQRVFSSPKTRRLHLIDTHAYPKEYFFAVTNKGVGGLLKKWGDGVSMLRKEWKDRDGDGDEEDVAENQMETDDGIPAEEPTNEHARTPQPKNKPKPPPTTKTTADDQLDGLTSSMTSLSLVPPSIRFGRGGKSGGFGNGNINGQTEPQNQSVDPQSVGNTGANNNNALGRGRGRGRGRGSIHPPANGNHIIPPSAQSPGPGVPRGGFAPRGLPAGRAGIINVRGRGRGVPRGRGRGGPGPM